MTVWKGDCSTAQALAAIPFAVPIFTVKLSSRMAVETMYECGDRIGMLCFTIDSLPVSAAAKEEAICLTSPKN